MGARPPRSRRHHDEGREPGWSTIVPNTSSIVSLLFVELTGEVVDVDVTLDIAHPTANELDVYLVSPTGTTVALTTDNGGGADDVFAGAIFDDQAAPPPDAPPGTPAPHVRSVTYADFTAVGPLQPEGALGAFFGDPAAGPWAPVVTDDGGGSLGTLNGWLPDDTGVVLDVTHVVAGLLTLLGANASEYLPSVAPFTAVVA